VAFKHLSLELIFMKKQFTYYKS